MRVVAGKYKGFNLMAPKGKNTRPTDNKIKEAIFDMLYPIKTNGNALDLFAGSGQMGIEFLSRGLEKVYFNESDRNSFRVLKENIEKIKDDNYELSKLDFKMALENYKNQGIKFDYIF
ncbi:Ribosomal RNA small subunit methyltransferase D [Anaerococcus octavius]|nr:Ribosomal RNA small subunit methyltransferase D [Anaerococcus octavius]